jgi:serine/threonine protein kinase
MVMDLCGTNLAEDIRARAKKCYYYSGSEVRQFLSSLIGCFANLQMKGYVHRDIKPDNILLIRDRPLDFKIVDFGFAVKINRYSTLNIAGTM